MSMGMYMRKAPAEAPRPWLVQLLHKHAYTLARTLLLVFTIPSGLKFLMFQNSIRPDLHAFQTKPQATLLSCFGACNEQSSSSLYGCPQKPVNTSQPIQDCQEPGSMEAKHLQSCVRNAMNSMDAKH